MSVLSGWKEKMKRVKGAEWAVLLIALGLAGSFLLAPGGQLFGLSGETDKTAASSASDALEERIGSVLSSMEGAGRVEVVIYYAKPAAASTNWLEPSQTQAEGEPIGVVVVAEGAGDLKVRLELARAVQTLLRLDADAVDVFKMDPGE